MACKFAECDWNNFPPAQKSLPLFLRRSKLHSAVYPSGFNCLITKTEQFLFGNKTHNTEEENACFARGARLLSFDTAAQIMTRRSERKWDNVSRCLHARLICGSRHEYIWVTVTTGSTELTEGKTFWFPQSENAWSIDFWTVKCRTKAICCGIQNWNVGILHFWLCAFGELKRGILERFLFGKILQWRKQSLVSPALHFPTESKKENCRQKVAESTSVNKFRVVGIDG